MNLGGPKEAQTAQAEPGTKEKLRDRGYTDKPSPPAVQKFEQSEELGNAYMDALFKRKKEYQAQGMSPEEALTKAQNDADLNALWRKSMGME